MSLLRFIACCAIPCGLMAQTECLTVTGDQIQGKDIARAVPALARIPRTTPLAPAPIMGASRVFSPSELQSLAARFSITLGEAQEVCFKIATEPLDRGKVETAMRKVLQSDARIEILETTATPVPAGSIEFPRESLGAPATPDQATGEIWRGYVSYAGIQRFQIWAKVRVTVPGTRLVAVEALKPGTVIRTEQVHLEVTERFPQPGLAEITPDQIAGMTPLRSISAGAEVRRDNLVRPNDVNRGDVVQVDVHVGRAHLALSGRAETGGRVGDAVSVRNPETSKVFQAFVASAGRVVVGSSASEIIRREGSSN